MPQPRITMRKIREVLRLHFESGRSIRQINVSTKTSIGAGMVGVHYSDPNVVNEDDSRAHAGLVITDQEPVPQSLEEVVLPAGPCAVLDYKGPYTAIKIAYDYLYGDWLPNSGKEPADLPPYELYLNNPMDTEESELLTNIIVPLQT